MASSSCFEYSTSEEEDTPRHCACSVNCYTSICRCRCHRRAAASPKRVVLRKLTAPLTGPCVSSASEEEVDEVFDAAQLVDLSINVKPESSGELQSKSAVEIFMEEKQEKVTAKKKMTAKLAMLEKEVTLGQHLLQQTKSLLKSKEALLMRKVRVTYNKCHSFMRGKVVYAHRSFVAEQVAAAKARLGLANTSHQFNIPAMVALIDKLAPEGKYLSSQPAPVPSATSRPWRRRPFAKKEEPRVFYFTVPVPPVPIQQRGHRSSHSAPAAPPGYRGDQCIVSYGDAIAEDPFCDFPSQFEQCAAYDWDGDYDFAFYEEEVEVDVGSSDIIWEDPGYGTAEVVPCIAADEDVCCVSEEVVSCFDAEEVVSCSDAEFSCYDADEEDCGYHDAELEESGYSGEDFYAY